MSQQMIGLKRILLVAGVMMAWSLSLGCGEDEKKKGGDDVSVDTPEQDAGGDDAGDAVATDTPATDAGEDASDAGEPDGGDEDTGPTDVPSPDVAEDTTPDIPVGECTQPCDCDQGQACIEGACVLGAEPVFCCAKIGCPDGKSCTQPDGAPGLCGLDTSAYFGSVVFNELLSDGETDGDPNGDGDLDPTGDEFVEIVNASGAAVDLSGFQLLEDNLPTPRHTFTQGTLLNPGSAIVVFGGGTAPDDTATAVFLTSSANDPFGLHLNNEGDTLRLIDADGLVVAVISYGPGAPLPATGDESMTRHPDISGEWVPHSTVSDTIFSPGTRVDGSEF